MEGVEKLRLIRPDLSHRNPIGEVVRGLKQVDISVWANREDSRGVERDYGFTETTDFNTIFVIRETSILRPIDETWYCVDKYDQTYDIVGVARRRRYNGRYQILLLQCKRRV